MVQYVRSFAEQPFVNLQDVFNGIYLDASTCREYHAKENDCLDADVGPWVDGQRVVCFSTPLRAPAVIRKTLGMDVLRVRELSQAKSQPDGSIVITSHPVVESPGGERFKTTAVTKIEPLADGGCQVLTRRAAMRRCYQMDGFKRRQTGLDVQIQASARCEAAGPWGMQGTIEDLMAKEALQTLQKFLAFAKQRCEEHFATNVRCLSCVPPCHCADMPPDRHCLPCAWQGALVSREDDVFHDADTGLPSMLHIPPGRTKKSEMPEKLPLNARAMSHLAALQLAEVWTSLLSRRPAAGARGVAVP